MLKHKRNAPEQKPRQTFREFYYARFPMIPAGQWGIAGEPQTEALSRFMTTAADYLDQG